MGSKVPISLLAYIMEIRIVLSVISSFKASMSTVPCSSTGRKVMLKNRKRFAFLALVGATVAVAVALQQQPASDNLLINSGFETGRWTRDTLYWTPRGGPFTDTFGEIFTPEGWVTWWFQDMPCTGDPRFNYGRPEVHVISLIPDKKRIRSGRWATMQFTFWRPHRMGLMQQVEVVPGASYDLSVYAHAWYSRCSSYAHGLPLDMDCVTPIDWAHDRLLVGIDPTGGLDPRANTVIWSEAKEIYGQYDEAVVLRSVKAQSDTMTIWLGAEATHPLKHNDVYWDDVTLVRRERTFLPLVVGR